jgi:hypothetical protein
MVQSFAGQSTSGSFLATVPKAYGADVVPSVPSYGDIEITGLVEYVNLGFRARTLIGHRVFYNAEIIGNAYENPALVEGGN